MIPIVSSAAATDGRKSDVSILITFKALHIIAMVTWFAGLFYLPRLFVYHADTEDGPGRERFKIMERRLLVMMHIGGIATICFALGMIAVTPQYLRMHWLQVKLVLVAALVAYHLQCMRFVVDFRAERNQRSSKWFRAFNEVPSVLLIAIVLLAVLRPW
jgi:putative membrane protein